MRYLLTVLLLWAFIYLPAQSLLTSANSNLVIDQRLYEVYDKTYLEGLKKSNPCTFKPLGLLFRSCLLYYKQVKVQFKR